MARDGAAHMRQRRTRGSGAGRRPTATDRRRRTAARGLGGELRGVTPWNHGEGSRRVSGCVRFRLRDGLKSRYIPFQCPSSHSKWRNRWFYLEIKDSNPDFVALPLTDIIGPLADHQVASSLKVKVVKEASDAATTSGGNVPTKPRKFSSVIGQRRKASTPSEELQVEMGRLLEAGARGIGREIAEARSEAAMANACADRLVRELAEAREDLTKMRELAVGNERQRKGLEDRMSELENNLSEIWGSLRVTYTGLHQLAGECGVTSTIPANPDEFSLTSSLAELATAMGEIPPSMRPGLRRRRQTESTPGRVMSSRVDIDDEDVQQRGQPESLAVIPVLEFEPHVSPDHVDQPLDIEGRMATTSSDLESALARQDRRIQYWKTKFEVAELERTMLAVKKEQAVETLRGREVWFNLYLKSCYTSMARVCRELRVVRGDPEESAAGYISWLNGACAQLNGIGKRIDEALKQEYRRSSRYAGGHVLACLRDHRLHLDLEHLREGFARSRRTPAEIDHLARSMSPLAEKIFQSMDWHWPSW
uniref:H0901F07.9 protein n=1 Tax=Oryza sativa TaxID=4530 RepID=Q259B1_ORYSA|nr:H0901F07.9 [Oryza sativa]